MTEWTVIVTGVAIDKPERDGAECGFSKEKKCSGTRVLRPAGPRLRARGLELLRRAGGPHLPTRERSLRSGIDAPLDELGAQRVHTIRTHTAARETRSVDDDTKARLLLRFG